MLMPTHYKVKCNNDRVRPLNFSLCFFAFKCCFSRLSVDQMSRNFGQLLTCPEVISTNLSSESREMQHLKEKKHKLKFNGLTLNIDHPPVKMRALKEAVALLVALVVTLEPANSKDVTMYNMAHVEANSWSSAQTNVHKDPM